MSSVKQGLDENGVPYGLNTEFNSYPASGDPNRVPSKDDTSHDSFREATYGSGGMIPADGPRDPAALDSVRMNSGAPVVGTEDLIATNDVEGKGQLATTTEVSTD